MATPTETQMQKPLLGHQKTVASQVLAETVGELAKRGTRGDDLRNEAQALATALCTGLSQINSLAPGSTPSASHESQ